MKEYKGYPDYVVISLPKCGTKSMNKCFSSLGYRFGLKLFEGVPSYNSKWPKPVVENLAVLIYSPDKSSLSY